MKNLVVSCHFILYGIFVAQCSLNTAEDVKLSFNEKLMTIRIHYRESNTHGPSDAKTSPKKDDYK